MFKQPTFGGGGLGGGGSNLFGQSSNTAFGTPPAFNAQTPFNSSTTGGLGGSTFAASSALKFPTSTTSGGGLFGNSGLGNQTSGFQTSQGGGLFGSGTTTGGGLFQTSQAGQANRSLFGGNNPTNVFGTPSSGTGTGSLFGPQQQSSFSTSSFGGGGLFRGGMGTGGGGSVFGGATTQGTPVKYQPTSGTDSLQRNGYTSTISTRLQVITGMKDYEAKSLDELRFEDYMQGRKGPQQASALGGGLFANQQKTGLFGQQNQQTSLAGTAFGQKPGGLFGQAQLGGSGGGGGLFGQQSKPGGLFGQNSSIGSQAGGLFGQQTSSSGLQLGQSTGFGAQQQTGVFGNKPGGLGGGFGGFQVGGSNTASTLFNQQSAGTGGLQLGGGSTGPGFGTGTGLNFGGVPTGGAFGVNKPGGLSLGTGGLGGTQTGGFSLGGGLGGGLGDGGLKLGQSFGTGGLQLGNTGTLGQTTGLGSQQHTGLGLGLGLGQTGLGLGGTSTLGGTQFAVVPQQELLKLQLQALKNSPFGDSPLFRNAVKEAKDSEPVKSTSGHAITRSTTTPSHYKVMPKPASKIKPRRITGKRDRDSKSQLFEDDEDESRLLSPVQPKRNIKTLVIKPKQSPEKLVIRTNSETNRESVVDTAVSTMPSDSSLAALITPQRPLTATVPFHSPETKAKGENPDDSQHIPSGTPNGVVGDTVNKTKSPGLVISENYTNPVIQPNPIRNRSLDDTVSELHGRKPAPDSESHDLSSYSTDGSVLSPSNTSHVQGSPVVSGATPDEVTGIMLLKPGYDTVPSMEELRHMARSQPAGELVVDDFTIQREGFGKVQFFGKTNVFGLNLDETVHIRRKEICVYPDEDLKPPQGEGLNKRARVTLTGTWPIDKSTREPIMDPERLQTMRYSEKVERSTLKMGATFIDYLPETGSWIFEVRHFSKYGLVDDDDSDDDSGDTVPKKIQNNQPQQQPRQQQAQQQPKQSTGQQVPLQKQPSHFTDNDTEMAEIPDDDSQRQPQQDANDSASVSSQSEVAIGLGGVNSRQVQVMKASFFGESVDENEKPQRVARLTPANAARHSMFGHRFSGNSLQSTSLDNSFMAGQGSHLLKQDRLLRPEFMKKQTSQDQSMSPMLAPYPQPIVLPTQRPPVLTSHSIPAARKVIWPVPWEKSLTKGKQKLLADAGLMMGRAFRVGWGPNWTLVHSGKEVSNVVKSNQNNRQMSLFGTGRQSLPRVRSTPYAVVIEKVSVSLDRIEDTQSHMLPSLEAVFAQSQRVIEDCDGVPYFSPSQGVSGLHTLSDALDKTYNKFSNTFSLRQADRTMKLAVALWGRLEGLDTDDDSFLDPDDSYERISGRRNAVSDWLAAAATEQIATDHPKTYLDQLFDLVAARQIPAACHLAQQHGDFQLAILLAQSSSTDHCRTLMLHQLAHYDVMKGSWFVDAKRLKIFVLLARGLTSSESLVWQGIQEHQSINACEGMDWKRCFALHLWYGCSATSSVKDALQQYSVAFKGRKDIEGYAAPPLPSHLEQNLCPVDQPGVLRQFLDGQDLRGHVRDTCYHLLKLYCKQDHRLERSLSPATYGFLPLDYFLSWILLQRLRSLEYNLMPGDRLSLTHTNFAAQLESVGLWHWAVFVLLHIEEAEARETAVRHMLARNCQLEPNEEEQKKEQFVSMNLLGSDEWLHEAKACYAHYDSDPDLEAYHLLKAGQWDAAHNVIVTSLASDAIIEEDYTYLKRLLEELADSERNKHIPEWPHAGGILLDYLVVSEKIEKLKQTELSDPDYELDELQQCVASLCSRLGTLKCQTAKDRLCQAEMAKRCANYMKILLFLLGHTGEDLVLDDSALPPVSLAPYIADLPMLEDYSLSELRALTQSYVVELAA